MTQALARYAPDVPTAGVCNAPYNAKMTMLRQVEQALGQAIAPPPFLPD